MTALIDLVVTATLTERPQSRAFLSEDARAPTHSGSAHELVLNLVRQLPLTDVDRSRLEESFAALPADEDDSVQAVLAKAAHLLRTRPPRIPTLAQERIALPPMASELREAYEVLIDCDRTVPEVWTLVGGLMVATHCAEHGLDFLRVTVDADLVAGVFIERSALATLTRRLRELGFHDATPDPLGGGPRLAYRWRREAAVVDVAVPPGANSQRRPPRAAGGLPAVELPGTQLALARTERVPVRLADGSEGHVRRPDLLGALIIKAVAATTDRRDPDRHRQDLLVLADLTATEGLHVEMATWIRDEDRRRIDAALPGLGRLRPRGVRDREAAVGVLTYLARPRR